MQIKNSSEWPNVFSCNFLEDGIVSYKDVDGGIAYISNETIKGMAQSFIGKPVCINHQSIDPENYEDMRKNGTIVGNVTRVWFNAEDGWWWAEFIVDTKEGRDRVRKNLDKVSCAYTVIDVKEGGLWHDIPYDVEITDGEFTHLALVETPRYENSEIKQGLPAMMINGKVAYHINNKEDGEMFEFLKKKAGGDSEKFDPVVKLNGKEYPLAEVLENMVTMINSKKEVTNAVKDTDIVDVNGHDYTIADLVKNMKEKLNEKGCTCGTDSDEHKENCGMYNKKNEKDAKEKDGKTPEEQEQEEQEHKSSKKNEKDMKEEEMKKEKENSKKKEDMTEFFNSLQTLANSQFIPSEDGLGQQPAPLTRQERANKKKKQVDSSMTN